MSDTDEGRKSRPVDDVDSEGKFLQADRDLTRQELEDTVEALAHKADLPTRSREAGARATKLVRRGATAVTASTTVWAVFVAATVAIVYVIVRSRTGRRRR